MKKRITIIILLLTWLIPSTYAQPIFTVRTIYFQPTDAPDPTVRIINLLIESENFYRSEMERHGYGAKTFQLETDQKGNVGFHLVKGKQKADHYLDDTYRRVSAELPFKFTLDPIAQDNVHVIIIGGLHSLDNGSIGYA